MEGHKDKKPTKKELVNETIPKLLKENLKDAHIKGLIQGFEISNRNLLLYAKEHTIEEVIDFCTKNVENKDVMENFVRGGEKVE